MNGQVIGLDIGGSKINGIVYDGQKIIRQLTVVTPKNLVQFKKVVTKLLEFLESGKNIQGLGVGMPGLVNKQGVVTFCPNIKYLERQNIQKFFSGFKFKKLVLENDANCFTLAESVLGKGKAYRDFMGVTLGTGIGGGFVFGKKLMLGSHGSAGEAGHVMADFKHDSEHYFQKARDKKDYKKMGQILGILFANIFNLVDVEGIVLGGTVATIHGSQFLPEALKHIKKHVVNKKFVPKISVSTLKDSGAIGAALLLKD